MSLKQAVKSIAEPDNRKACDRTSNILQLAFIHENCAFNTASQYLVPGTKARSYSVGTSETKQMWVNNRYLSGQWIAIHFNTLVSYLKSGRKLQSNYRVTQLRH